MHFWSPFPGAQRGSCSTGFAGECQAEAKLKMEDEVKIEEGPKVLSFLRQRGLWELFVTWNVREVVGIQCFKWVKVSNICLSGYNIH